MKTSPCIAAFTICIGAALAQIESVPATKPAAESEARKLPNTLEEVRKPELTPAPSNRSPDEIIATFFDALKAARVEAAYSTLHSQFALQDRADEAEKMQQQTQRALDAYGPVVGYELVREEKFGTHLMRRTYVLVGASLPLRWQFYFYQAGKDWQLIDLRVDDALVDWFDASKK